MSEEKLQKLIAWLEAEVGCSCYDDFDDGISYAYDSVLKKIEELTDE